MKNKESRLKGYSKNFCCCVANSCAISRALAVNIVNIYLFKVFWGFFSHAIFSRAKILFLTEEKNSTMTYGTQAETMVVGWILPFHLCWAVLLTVLLLQGGNCFCFGDLMYLSSKTENHWNNIRGATNKEYHTIGSILVSLSISFRLIFFIFCCCVLLSTFIFFSPKSSPHSCLCPLLSVFFILRGFSPFIHPDQVAIPYKAKGSPHLASYFPIRSVVTDRIYTGSSLECEAASPSAMPQTPLCSLLRSTNLVKPPLLPLLPLLFLQLL